MDLSITSYLYHLGANLLHSPESVTISSIFEWETCLEVAIVGVHLPSRADWANPLKSIGSTRGSSGVGIALVGKTDNPLGLWSSEDLRKMMLEGYCHLERCRRLGGNTYLAGNCQSSEGGKTSLHVEVL